MVKKLQVMDVEEKWEEKMEKLEGELEERRRKPALVLRLHNVGAKAGIEMASWKQELWLELGEAHKREGH